MHDQEWSNREERGVEESSTNISPAMIAWGVAAALAIAFILQNQSDTTVKLLFWSFDTNVWVAIVIAMVLGALLGWLGVKMLRRRQK